jgi:predicted acetyltransferase
MELTKIQKEQINNLIKNKCDQIEKSFSENWEKHIQKGDFENWLENEADNEPSEKDNLMVEIKEKLNITDCENEIQELLKKYFIEKYNATGLL